MKTRHRKIIVTIGVLVIIAMSATAIVLGRRHAGRAAVGTQADNTALLEGTLECTEVDVAAKIPGRILTLYVNEGDPVQAGQVIGTLESKEVDAKVSQADATYRAALTQQGQAQTATELQRRNVQDQIAQAQAGHGAARAKLSMAINGARPQEIEQAQRAVDAAKAQYETADQAYSDQIAQAQAGLNAAQARLRMARNGARPQEITQAEKACEQAQAAFRTARDTYNRYEGLYKRGVIPRQKEEEIEYQYLAAKAQKEGAEARLSMLREGTRKEEIEQAEQGVHAAQAQLKLAQDSRMHLAAKAQLQSAEAKLRLVREGTRKEEIAQAYYGVSASQAQAQQAKDSALQVTLRQQDEVAAGHKANAAQGQLNEAKAYQSETQIIAPITGYVSQKIASAGEMISAGYPIVTLVKAQDFKVKVYADESKYGTLELNEPLKIIVPALNNAEVDGFVARINPAADFATRKATNEAGSFDVRSLEVVVRVTGDQSKLRNGMTARVRVPTLAGQIPS